MLGNGSGFVFFGSAKQHKYLERIRARWAADGPEARENLFRATQAAAALDPSGQPARLEPDEFKILKKAIQRHLKQAGPGERVSFEGLDITVGEYRSLLQPSSGNRATTAAQLGVERGRRPKVAPTFEDAFAEIIKASDRSGLSSPEQAMAMLDDPAFIGRFVREFVEITTGLSMYSEPDRDVAHASVIQDLRARLAAAKVNTGQRAIWEAAITALDENRAGLQA
ncbi:MAG: hypothetical protein IT384_27000 [Deltaproteobacteria bacterium]|nr:hypothetical protein [Deltaproteobacteria bacterium]